MLNLNEGLELALHRALRGEVQPCVHAITADLSVNPIHLHVYRYQGYFEEQGFEDVVESEMDQCLPEGADKSLAHIVCSFHDVNEFDVPSAFYASDLCLICLNHNATAD